MENPSDNMTVWKTWKVIPKEYVDKNPVLTILIGMGINKIIEYDRKVECDENSCVVRYIKNGETLGLLRFSYILGWGKKIRQDIIILKELSITNLLGDLMVNEKFTEDMGEVLTQTIRRDAISLVKEYLSEYQ